MSEEERNKSLLEEGIDDLGRMVDGLAGRLLGPGATNGRYDPEEPVFGEPVDQAISDLGAAFGRVLAAAGDQLQRSSGEEPADADEEADTPLVHGARSFARGLSAATTELLASVATPVAHDEPAGEE